MASIEILNQKFYPSSPFYEKLKDFIINDSQYALFFYSSINSKICIAHEHIEDTNINLAINFRLIGGKGGFGTMLKAAGVRMGRCSNDDDCRNLEGRRMRDVRNDKKLEEWLAKNPPKPTESKKEQKIKKLKSVVDSCSGKKEQIDEKIAESIKNLQTINENILNSVNEGINRTKNTPNLKEKKTGKAKPLSTKKANLMWGFDDSSSDDSNQESSTATENPPQ